MTKTENKILKKFGATNVIIEVINGVPMFELYSTGMALGYTKSNTIKGKNYIQCRKDRVNKILKNIGINPLVQGGLIYLTVNQVYDFMLEAHTVECKPFRKWITDEVLPMIEKTGGYIEKSQEEIFVNNYLSGLSEQTKVEVIKELHDNNEELQEENRKLNEWYSTFIETKGLISMNVVAKELHIGLKRLYKLLRENKTMFYKGNINIPYQRFMEQNLFEIKETPCRDGNYRPQTYATKKGLEYIRKIATKDKELCTN